jgi:hypothetical protein
MLVIKRRMNAIKQPSKRDNVHQRSPGITQFSKNYNSKNIIKSVFDVDLNHGLIKVLVEEGSNAKKDGLKTSKGRNFKLVVG